MFVIGEVLISKDSAFVEDESSTLAPLSTHARLSKRDNSKWPSYVNEN